MITPEIENDTALTPEERRKRLYDRLRQKYLDQRAEGEKVLEQPYETGTDLADSQRISAMASGLSKAAAKMGSIYGKAPTTDVPESLAAMDAATEGEYRRDLLERDRAQSLVDASNKGLLGLSKLEEADVSNVAIPEDFRADVNADLARKGFKIQIPEGMTYKQLKANPFLDRASQATYANKPAGKVYKTTVVNPDGTLSDVVYDVGTGTSTVIGQSARGTRLIKTPEGEYVGARPGEIPQLGSGGRTPAQIEQAREVETARKKALVSEEVKEKQEVEKAVAAQKTWENFVNRAGELREKAKEYVGPIMGRVTEGAGSFGVSLDEAATRLNSMITAKVNQYIKEMTGVAAGDKEMKRLQKVLPSIAQDKVTFDIKLSELKMLADEIVNERLISAGKAPVGEPVVDSPETVKETPKKTPSIESGRKVITSIDEL